MKRQGSRDQHTAEFKMLRYPSNTQGFFFFFDEKVLRLKSRHICCLPPGPLCPMSAIMRTGCPGCKIPLPSSSPGDLTVEGLLHPSHLLWMCVSVYVVLYQCRSHLESFYLLLLLPEILSPYDLYRSQIKCYSNGNTELHNRRGLTCLVYW